MTDSPARTVFLLSLAAFASAVALRLCDPMLPAIARSFAVSTGGAAIVITAATVSYGVCQLFFGPLGDRYGKIRVLSWACLASTLGAMACALSPTLEGLTLGRALTGATTAALIPLSMAWIGDTIPIDRRQPTLARFMSGQILGLVSGQAVGGLLADTLGWRWAFVLLALVYAAVGILLLRARSPVHSQGETSSTGARIKRVIGSRAAWVILPTVFLEALASFGVIAFIPAYLHHKFGISLFHAGTIVASFGLGGLVYTLFARRWVLALGGSGLALSGGILMGLAFLILMLADHWAWGVAASTLAGLGFYQFHNTLQTQATQMAPEARGTAVSLFAACFFLGQSAGVSLAAVVVDRLSPAWLFACSALLLPLLGAYFGRHLRKPK